MLSEEIQNMEAQLREGQNRLNELIEQRENLIRGNLRTVADYLHKHLCHTNHTDGCGYGYEKWQDVENGLIKQSTKGRWLEKAETVVRFSNQKNVKLIELLDLIIAVDKY